MKFHKMIRIIREYTENTTIHGINYIFESGIPIIERLLWIVAMIIMLIFASFLSLSAYKEWEDHPVVTTVMSTGKPIEEIEFPAITICAQVFLYLKCLYTGSSISASSHSADFSIVRI